MTIHIIGIVCGHKTAWWVDTHKYLIKIVVSLPTLYHITLQIHPCTHEAV